VTSPPPVVDLGGSHGVVLCVNLITDTAFEKHILSRHPIGGGDAMAIAAGPVSTRRCLPDSPRRRAMTTYVMLTKWTEQGMRQVKDSTKRLDLAKKALKDMGGEFKSFFMTMGDYDIVAVYEAPDDAVAARFTMMLGMLGNVRTTTLKAFPEAAYREIVNSLR
jgi:uncharacterized protein with GYD domain